MSTKSRSSPRLSLSFFGWRFTVSSPPKIAISAAETAEATVIAVANEKVNLLRILLPNGSGFIFAESKKMKSLHPPEIRRKSAGISSVLQSRPDCGIISPSPDTKGADVANFTKQAIRTSFMKLLNEKPLGKISVRDIVEDCGINRNSFYYHYQDIPALISEIITGLFDRLIAAYPDETSLVDCFNAAVDYTLKNKRAILHIYNSVSRDIFETYLMKYSEYAVTEYLSAAFSDGTVSEEDREIIIRFVKCSLFGISLDWLSSGLPEEAVGNIRRMLTVSHGMSEDIIRRCAENEKKR